MVFTTISKEAMPLLRYRTRDLTRLCRKKCDCGRTLVRMEKCLGRTDDMLIIRGVNVFPSQIESVLLDMSETTPHYQLIVRRENNLDTLEVKVEIDELNWSDSIRELEAIRGRVHHNIRSMLGISATIKLVEPNSIQRSEGKAQRILDYLIMRYSSFVYNYEMYATKTSVYRCFVTHYGSHALKE